VRPTRGSPNRTPAFAPPNDRSTAAHYHVMTRASRATSVTVREGLIRVPGSALAHPAGGVVDDEHTRIPLRGSATVTTSSCPTRRRARGHR
jgi:hypothetical protein